MVIDEDVDSDRVEKVDFPQYINIWYIFLDLKK
jgi:hypothetical protein